MSQVWFSFYNGFSGQTMFDSWHLTFYNLVFTALPAMFFAVLDRDVKKKAVRVFPELYECGLKVELFVRTRRVMCVAHVDGRITIWTRYRSSRGCCADSWTA